MKLSTKLILSFLVVFLLVGGIGITSSYINESVKDQVTSESEQAIEEIQLAGEMGLQLYQSLTRTQYLLEDPYRQSLSTDLRPASMSNEYVQAQIDSALKKFRRSIAKTKKLVQRTPGIQIWDTTDTAVIFLLDKLEEKYRIYSSLIDQLRQLSLENYDDSKEFFTVTIEPYFRSTLLPLIERVRERIQTNHEARIETLNNQLATTSQILGIATFLALVIALVIAFFLYRSIANPLNKLANAAQSIGKGNLSNRIDYKSQDELGQLSESFNRMAENLSLTTVSRDYVDSIIESMADLLIVTDVEYAITRINSAGLLLLGETEEKLIGKPVESIFTFEDRSDQNFDIKGNAEKINSQNAYVRTSREKVPVSLSKGTIRGRRGEIEGYVIVASDISSEREAQEKIKRSLKDKEVMLAEIHHRVKNNLAVISGLLQMQIWEAENDYAVTALQESQLRVRSIALVHEKLYQSESFSYIEFDKYILNLLQAIRDTYISEHSSIEIVTELEEVILNINQAIPCSLLLNELVVNAFKHAFNRSEKGIIKVCMVMTDNEVSITVKDNGVGFPHLGSTTETLGMSLIDTLSRQLEGELTFKNDDGAEINVTFDAKSDEHFDQAASHSPAEGDDSQLW